MTHAFAPFIRTLGKGPGLSRALTWDEAYAAMQMILSGEVEALQLGAFLCLMRYKKETPTELAAFVQASRDSIDAPASITVDLDWPSYADKHQQLPWFVLSALLLAENGSRVLMHGIAGLPDSSVSTRQVLQHLGIAEQSNWSAVGTSLDESNFAYLGLEHISKPLNDLFALRPLLGLRSPVNSLARALNPLASKNQLQGVFHPTYCEPHRQAGLMLQQTNLAAFKGGGGEIQANPYKALKVFGIRDGAACDETWDAALPTRAYRWRDEEPDPKRVAALWDGTFESEAAQAAVCETAAIALKLTGKAKTQQDARQQSRAMWTARRKNHFI
ncbi:MAG: anthranilate phosphoribosyltransferase [Gammaproteobacteria bacterium]|jgi:anthranilate phosphoribosyltransferase